MDILKDGLLPPVAQMMQSRYGPSWWDQYKMAFIITGSRRMNDQPSASSSSAVRTPLRAISPAPAATLPTFTLWPFLRRDAAVSSGLS